MISTLVCLLLILILQLATPFWWWIMLVPFLFGLTKSSSISEGFKVGACSAGLLWLLASAYGWMASSQRVSDRMITMMGLETNGILLVIATGLLAALAAGCAGMAGFVVRSALRQRQTSLS